MNTGSSRLSLKSRESKDPVVSWEEAELAEVVESGLGTLSSFLDSSVLVGAFLLDVLNLWKRGLWRHAP
jgi:hypothetical protein